MIVFVNPNAIVLYRELPEIARILDLKGYYGKDTFLLKLNTIRN